MPALNRQPMVDHTLYTMAELIELRRKMLRFSRSIPPGPERNKHLRIAISLGRLLKNKQWLDAHTVEGSQ
jgi:hypothetical protein